MRWPPNIDIMRAVLAYVCVCVCMCFGAIPYATNITSKQRHHARWFGVCVCVLVCVCVFWGHPICHEHTFQTSTSCAAEDYVHDTATLCNIPLHTATHCNTLQHTATRCNKLNILQHTATYCNMLQYHSVTLDSKTRAHEGKRECTRLTERQRKRQTERVHAYKKARTVSRNFYFAYSHFKTIRPKKNYDVKHET